MVKARLVYDSPEKGVVSNIFILEPYEYTLATRGKWEMIISNENCRVKTGDVRKIKIKPILLQTDILAFPDITNRHGLVNLISIGSEGAPRTVECERSMDTAYLLAHKDGDIMKQDLLGVINIFPIMFSRYLKHPVKVKS